MKHALTVVADGVLLADVRERPDSGVLWFPLRNEGMSHQDFLVTYLPRTDKERQFLLRVLKQGAQVHVVADMASKQEGEGSNARLKLLLAAYRCEVRAEAPVEESKSVPEAARPPAPVAPPPPTPPPPAAPPPAQPAAPAAQAPPLRASAPPVHTPARDTPPARPAAPQAPAVFPHVNDKSWG